MISVVTGFLVWLTLSLIGQDLAPLWGLLAFLLNYIPNLGSFFIMAATMTLGLIQFYPEWNRVAAVWITMPVIQIIMGNILDPQLQGDQLDLSPLVILISLVVWGWIWGVTGMFLAVPLTVGLKIVLAHIRSLKPVAVMMGSGKMSRSFRRQWRRSGDRRRGKAEEVPTDAESGTHPRRINKLRPGSRFTRRIFRYSRRSLLPYRRR
jgi:AI-2 transport protein TqsA